MLQAILAVGGQLASKCGGNASCGACHVFVTEGRKGLTRLTPAENAIRHAIHTVAQLGSDQILTNAVMLLIEAQKDVAAYVDMALAGPPEGEGQPAPTK